MPVMGYDWESHKETCHRLYISEGWSLERIMDYLKTGFGFTPRYAQLYNSCTVTNPCEVDDACDALHASL